MIMVEMTIKLPDSLAEQLSAVQDRVPELLAQGLGKLSPVPNEVYRYILEFLVSRPSPEEIMDFGPTPAMQARASELLEKNRTGKLSSLESAELDEYMRINHLITMLKAQTLPYLPSHS
jgi:hypothetical protein